MGHRRERRVQLNSQASLCGMDPHWGRSFLEPVMIHNISSTGLLVQVTRCPVSPGDIVVLRHKQSKGRFRVIWVEETPDRKRKKLGLQHVLSTPLFWGLELPLPAPDDYRRPRVQARRRYRRYSRELAVELRVENSRIPFWSSTSDISEAGCFVQMLDVLPISARLDIAMWVGGVKVWAQGMVVSNLSGSGIRIKFIAISEEGRHRLRELIESGPEVIDRRFAPDESLDIERETYLNRVESRPQCLTKRSASDAFESPTRDTPFREVMSIPE
jgi:PilZ domain